MFDPRAQAEIEAEIAGETICRAFQRTCAAYPDRPALWRRSGGAGWRALSWREYGDAVKDFALGLIALGVEPGAFGAIIAANRPEHVIADMAIVHSGAVPFSISVSASPEQIAYLVGHCGAVVAIVETVDSLARLRAALPARSSLEHVVLIEGEAEGALSWADVVEAGRRLADGEQIFEARWTSVEPESLITLVFTSGTTGPPKGVMLTHRNILFSLACSGRIARMGPGDSFLSYLPLGHFAERYTSHWHGIVRGAATYFCASIDEVPAVLLEARPRLFFGTPRIWEKLQALLEPVVMDDPALRQAYACAAEAVRSGPDSQAGSGAAVAAARRTLAAALARIGLEECVFPIVGGAPPVDEVFVFFRALGAELCNFWGASELGGSLTWWTPDYRIGTAGRPMPAYDYAILEDGELLVRGGSVSQGYFRDPVRTAEAFNDGWWRSGDIVRQEPDGAISIVARKKDLIITSGGENISPANIETLLKADLRVAHSCVVGDGRRYLVAILALEPSAVEDWARRAGVSPPHAGAWAECATLQEEVRHLVRAVNDRLSRVEQIKRFALVDDPWSSETGELTATLKIRRAPIAERYAALIDDLYAGRQGVEVEPRGG